VGKAGQLQVNLGAERRLVVWSAHSRARR
jgi:hypothetical protein